MTIQKKLLKMHEGETEKNWKNYKQKVKNSNILLNKFPKGDNRERELWRDLKV